MSVIICRYCDRYIDLDWNVEHEADCAFEHGVAECEVCGTSKDEHRNENPNHLFRFDGVDHTGDMP